MISLAKKGDLAARRAVLSYLQDSKVAMRLFSEVAPLFSAIEGGYTRLIKTRVRYGDGAPMVIVELIKRTVTSEQGKDKTEKVTVEGKGIVPVEKKGSTVSPASAAA